MDKLQGFHRMDEYMEHFLKNNLIIERETIVKVIYSKDSTSCTIDFIGRYIHKIYEYSACTHDAYCFDTCLGQAKVSIDELVELIIMTPGDIFDHYLHVYKHCIVKPRVLIL